MRCILLAVLCGMGFVPTASQDIARLLERYREETISRPSFLEGGTRTETSRALENIGPNILPILADFIEREGDQRVRKDLTGLFQRISGFRQYRYVQDPAKSANRLPVENNLGALPILSRDVAKGNNPTETANQLLTWWNLRHTFLCGGPDFLGHRIELICATKEDGNEQGAIEETGAFRAEGAVERAA